MKMMLYHLTGSLRGRTQYLDADFIRFGVGESCGIVFDSAIDSMVCPVHAELSVEDHTPHLRDRSDPHALFVNGQLARDVVLADGDLLQFGEHGPQVRFRLMAAAAPETKPLRHIVQDSRDIVVRTPHPRYMSLFYLARHVLADVARYGSPAVKVGTVVALMAPLVIIVGLGVLLYGQYRAAGEAEQRMAELVTQLETGRLTQAELERRVETEREQIAELEREREALAARLGAAVQEREAARMTREEMVALRRELSELEGAQRFAEEIVRRYERGVGLLQGGFAFREKETGRLLRYRGFDAQGYPLRDEKGQTLVTVEGTAPPVVFYYAGTGFLVDGRGLIVTNRHLARMWETYEPAQQALEAGFVPDLRIFRIFFPGITEAYLLEVVAVSESADLAVLRTLQRPAQAVGLPLSAPEELPKEGEPVVVLSYPGTFDSLLARLSQSVSEELLREIGSDPVQLAETLARRNLIRPLVTQGHVSGVSPDVTAFEAGAGGGSSGGPVLDRKGRVIAVNQAALQRVGGVNLGVPIRSVWDLLRQAGVALNDKDRGVRGGTP